MHQVPSDGAMRSLRMESPSVPGPAGPWWLASRTLPPAPFCSVSSSHTGFLLVLENTPPSGSLLPAHRTVSFWSGLSPASLFLSTQVYVEKAPPLQGSLPWSPCLKLFPVIHCPPLLPGLCTLFTARWALIHTACIVVPLCPLLLCGSLGVSFPRL